MMYFEDITWHLSSFGSLGEIDYSELEQEYYLELQKTVNDSPTDCEFSGQVFYNLYRRDDSQVCICSFISSYCDGNLEHIEKMVTDQIRYEFFVSKTRDVIRNQIMTKILDL